MEERIAQTKSICNVLRHFSLSSVLYDTEIIKFKSIYIFQFYRIINCAIDICIGIKVINAILTLLYTSYYLTKLHLVKITVKKEIIKITGFIY